MFYSQFILAKKGPLGTIWIAAHLERKLRKNQVADTDIGVSVDSILFPEVPIALRLSSHLLLGVVRIYSRKVNYLFDDCSEALLKVKQAFRSAAVDLPPEESKAPYHSITLPETFDLDDFELPDTETFQGNFVDHHVSAKEQITLQDTMDGVVYSTSQFGLDERFGDGDASQIGLDLDEELLLNKGTSSGHGVLLTSSVDPQTLFEPSSSQKVNEIDGDMHEASQAVATDCSIEAPSTPGLVEGPNLPSTQEALVSDDHMEEDHNPTEFAAEDKGGPAPSHAQEIGLNETMVSLNDSHNSSSLSEQPDCCQGKPSVNVVYSVSESTSIVDKSSLEHSNETEGKLHINSNSENKGWQEFEREEASEISSLDAKTNTLSVREPILQPCNFHNNQENAELDNVVSVPNPTKDFGVDSEGMSGREDAPDVSVAEVQDVTNLNLSEDELLNAAPCNKSVGQPVISENVQFQKGNDCKASKLPSAEKLLSLPDMPVIQSNELFIGSTPEREVHVQDDQDATMNKISGKKRSLTESTITFQSLNSVESSEAAQSKTSVEFVPDDDDLLSSILVGRRSTMLKVKSTPPAFDSVSSKRPRVTNRSGAHKRKVLVDDSMVLHGDTIRQQLVNTEDIRRVRKKAPSTHPEIWILQKQFLEDEMFNEPLLTGMSSKLISLHCQTYDLSEAKLGPEDGSKSQSTTVDLIGSPIRPTVGEGIEFEGTGAPSLARDETAQQSADCAHDIPIQSSIIDSSDLGGNALENERLTDSEVVHTSSQFDILKKGTEMEMECRREPIGDETDQPVASGAESSSCPPVNDENIVAEDRTSDEGRTQNPERANKDEFPESDLQYDDMGGLVLDHQRENSMIDCSNPVGGDLVPGNVVFIEEVNLENQLAESQIFMDATGTASGYPPLGNLNDLEADAIEHDTDFLNFDDDEIAEEDENSVPNAEGPQILDNGGWSTRTRAVANYLQVLFQKEAQYGRKVLHVDNLLANKSRKEASRMFFETLVLKTQDYIHVEQEGPFGNIGVKPRARLLKSDF